MLLQALEQDRFFVGAMGSRRTHAERRRRLIEAGGDPHLVDHVVGPVGLIEATRDPKSLAVSIWRRSYRPMTNIWKGGQPQAETRARMMSHTQHFVEQDRRDD